MLRKTSVVAALFALSLLAGCGRGNSSSGPPPTSAQLTISPSATLTFPSTTIGQSSAPQTLTLTNSGNATLTLSVGTLAGATADFTATTTCGTSLAASASCTFSITFMPQAAGTLTATITLTDNASNSPQTVTLTGSGTGVPQATLTPTGLTFPITSINSTSAAQTVTLSNSGTAALSIAGIAVSGTNASDFAETNTCSGTLAAGSSCTISVTFTPAAATSYTAILTVTDNSGNTSGATQSVNLSGTGTSVFHTLLVFPELDKSVTQLYTLINKAQNSIDMTMYKFEDTTFLSDLVTACTNGVKVRVLLDGGTDTKSINTPAYTQLNTSGPNCSAVFSNTAFQATHQKTITVDSTTTAMVTAIMTLNLQPQYYSTSRDFALVENDSADIAAIEATFEADYKAGTPYQGTQGASDFANQGGAGDDLIWSPTTATSTPLIPRTAANDMLNIIKGATKTLLIENADMSPSGDKSSEDIVTALENACHPPPNTVPPVTVNIVMSEDSTTPPLSPYVSNWLALEVAGCGLHVYADTTTGKYIHANAVVADYGLSTQNAYVGSIKYSDASMLDSRELGLYVTDPAAVALLNTTMSSDYAGGVVFQGGIVF